jgi:hypothetical protein
MTAEGLNSSHRRRQALALSTPFSRQKQACKFMSDQGIDGFPRVPLISIEFWRQRPELVATKLVG